MSFKSIFLEGIGWTLAMVMWAVALLATLIAWIVATIYVQFVKMARYIGRQLEGGVQL